MLLFAVLRMLALGIHGQVILDVGHLGHQGLLGLGEDVGEGAVGEVPAGGMDQGGAAMTWSVSLV